MVYFLYEVGKDAVILNNTINYKPVCMVKEVCKCGIPVNTFKQVIPKLIETGYNYIVYDYNKEDKTVQENI